MTEQEKDDNSKYFEGNRDNPEQYPTENESLLDKCENEQTVDSIPMEDLTMEKQEEKRRMGESKHTSSSEKKYHTGFE
ncbi:MAG TPA: hypothetical protein VGI33_07625 [Paenibacillus sp.]|jgi:hypothetical protein